ncbi:MAG: 2OG-Fe(II) oxygenase [Planctomycetaceae bacterium]
MTDFIEVYDDALPEELCEKVRAKFLASEPSRGQTGAGVDLERKDSHDINISRAADWQELNGMVMQHTTTYLREYMKTYSHLLTGAIGAGRTNPESGEPEQLAAEDLDDTLVAQLMMKLYRPGDLIAQQYAANVGGYHHWHSEIYPLKPNCETLHRVLLFMFYINTVEEGGETEFVYQNRNIAPQAGRMVVAPAGFTHTHKGHVPLSDDKLILTSWILFNRAEAIYGQPST